MLCIAILSVPVIASAGISLSPIMDSWSHTTHSIDATLAGRRPYDATALRADVLLYINDAARVAHHINGGSAEARDFAGRFAAFAEDGRLALGSVGQPAAFRPRFDRMLGDCQSCHAAYNK
jgi:cytochrome c556